jgi:hypothetical protein
MRAWRVCVYACMACMAWHACMACMAWYAWRVYMHVCVRVHGVHGVYACMRLAVCANACRGVPKITKSITHQQLHDGPNQEGERVVHKHIQCEAQQGGQQPGRLRGCWELDSCERCEESVRGGG